jgi:hypothetical protein
VILDHTPAASGPEWSPNGRRQQVSDRATLGVAATGVARPILSEGECTFEE